MKMTIKSVALPIMFTAIIGSSTTLGMQPDPESWAHDNTAFALSLYGKLASTDGNLFFSPYSISSAMGMTYAGARGNTAAEIAKALGFDAPPEQLPLVFKNLKAALQASALKGGHKLTIANALYLAGGDVSADFKTSVRENFEAEIFDGGLETINQWVKEKTEGKIENILEGVSPNSVCVLLNAVYFKGDWASQFKRDATQYAPFRLTNDKSVQVPLMYQQGRFKLLEKDEFQALVMPYGGNTLSMVIILPKTIDGLAAIERKLTAETLAQWLAESGKQAKREVRVFVPRFTLETSYDLVSSCRALGIKDAFKEGRADFRGMGWEKGELWIAEIKHKAYVNVNEEGTEAAGATAARIQAIGIRHYPVFKANHPFLFVIREHATGTILFLGRLSDPTKQGR